jgi:hypothetical protein
MLGVKNTLGGAATASARDLNAVAAIQNTGINTMIAMITVNTAFRLRVNWDLNVTLSTRVA